MNAHHVAIAKDAGFTEEPGPDYVLVRAERTKNQPAELAELGLVRVRYRLPSGGWSYDTVPVTAIATKKGDDNV